MAIAITEEHRALAGTTSDFLAKRNAMEATRALLEAGTAAQSPPAFWRELADLGWLGLHVPEQYGGAGYGLEELAIVAEQMGRALAPGPFAPTTIASAVLAAAADDAARKRLLPGLTDGSVIGAVALEAAVTVRDGTVSGSAPAVAGGGLAHLLLIPAGEDVAVGEAGEGVSVEVPANLDPSRPAARVRFDNAPATIVPGARRVLVDLA